MPTARYESRHFARSGEFGDSFFRGAFATNVLMICRRVAFAALTLCAAARTASGQQVRGTVRAIPNGHPLSGAVALLLDSADRPLARAITSEAGAYQLEWRLGARRVRIVRLGFKASTIDVAPIGTDVFVETRMVPLPTLLEPVTSLANSRCPRTAGQSAALGLWQQARVGLLAMLVARDADPPALSLLSYSRMPVANAEARYQRVTATEGRWVMAFGAAQSADQFLDRGFVEETPTGERLFYGPDAETLFNEAFQTVYCLSLVPPDHQRRTEVGVRFVRPERRRGRVDLDGIMWLDTAQRRLQSLEFRYVGLDVRSERLRPGGRVHFREMPNGALLMDLWSIRNVAFVRDSSRALRDLSVATEHERRYFVTEGGGAILRASWPDGREWHAEFPTVVITIVDERGKPIKGAYVALDSTHYHASADSGGVAHIGDVLPGPYRVVVAEAASLAAINVTATDGKHVVVGDDSVAAVRLVVPRSAFAQRCGPDEVRIVARVSDSTNRPSANTPWTVGPRHGRTDSKGLLQSCVTAAIGDTIQLSLGRPDSPRRPLVIVRHFIRDKIIGLRVQVP